MNQQEMKTVVAFFMEKLQKGNAETWSSDDVSNLGVTMNTCPGVDAVRLWDLLSRNFPLMLEVHPHVYKRMIRIAEGQDDGTKT